MLRCGCEWLVRHLCVGVGVSDWWRSCVQVSCVGVSVVGDAVVCRSAACGCEWLVTQLCGDQLRNGVSGS